MPGPPPDVTTKRWYSELQALTPRREQPCQLPRVLVVARPLDGLARSHQLGIELRVGVQHPAGTQRLQRALRAFAAVHAGRSKKHHGVLDFLFLEAPQRFQVFGENAYRTRFRRFRGTLDTDRRAAVAPYACHSIRCHAASGAVRSGLVPLRALHGIGTHLTSAPAFGRRCILPGCVAPPSGTAALLQSCRVVRCYDFPLSS